MRISFYIDAFNLYYGCLKGTQFRWLDIQKFCEVFVRNQDNLVDIKYFTAQVQSRTDHNRKLQQKTYLRALQTLPNLSIYFGHFLSQVASMPTADNPKKTVSVIRTEEKGSDVNLASHLLADGFQDKYDTAIIVSNDSDYLEAICIAQEILSKKIGAINPHKRASKSLLKQADFFRSVRKSTLQRCQFPNELEDIHGIIRKPPNW